METQEHPGILCGGIEESMQNQLLHCIASHLASPFIRYFEGSSESWTEIPQNPMSHSPWRNVVNSNKEGYSQTEYADRQDEKPDFLPSLIIFRKNSTDDHPCGLHVFMYSLYFLCYPCKYVSKISGDDYIYYSYSQDVRKT